MYKIIRNSMDELVSQVAKALTGLGHPIQERVHPVLKHFYRIEDGRYEDLGLDKPEDLPGLGRGARWSAVFEDRSAKVYGIDRAEAKKKAETADRGQFVLGLEISPGIWRARSGVLKPETRKIGERWLHIGEQAPEKLTNERAALRPANPENEGERCRFCKFFVSPDVCKIVEGPVAPDLVCDWIQSRGVKDAPSYKIADKDWVSFGLGMIEEQPYQHIVKDVALTPEGPMVLIADTAEPPHLFSLDKEFHVGHTSFEHHWTQVEVDRLVGIGNKLSEAQVKSESGRHAHPHDLDGKHQHDGLPAGGGHAHTAEGVGGHIHRPGDPFDGQHFNVGNGQHDHLLAKGLLIYIKWTVEAHHPRHKWLKGHVKTWIRHIKPAPAEKDFREANEDDWSEHTIWWMHSTGRANPDAHAAVFLDPGTKIVEKEYEFEDGTRRPATMEDFEAEEKWFQENTPPDLRKRLAEAGVGETENVSGLSNRELIELHGELHDVYTKEGGAPGIVPRHIRVVQELTRRGMEHRPKDQLDSITLEQTNPEILLGDITKAFQTPVVLRKPFLALVGSVAVDGKGKDLDIWVNWPASDEEFLRVLRFRIKSMLPADYNVQLLPDHMGPFTNFMPIADLEVRFVPPEKREIQQMSEATGDCMSRAAAMRARKRTPKDYPVGFFRIFHHMRGKSVHKDLRFVARSGSSGFLEGWTITDQPAGAVKREPIPGGKEKTELTRTEVSQGINKAYDIQGRVKWKFRPNMKVGDKVNAVKKKQQPSKWMNVFNVAFAPGFVGATSEEAGVFTLCDEGNLDLGVQKPEFKEYFLNGKVFKGRIGFRLISTEGFDKPTKGETQWQVSANLKDQTPNILSVTERRRDRKEQYVPKQGEKAIPPEWEKLIKPSHRWWQGGATATERIRRLNLAYNDLAERGITKTRLLKLTDKGDRIKEADEDLSHDEEQQEKSFGDEAGF